MRFSRRRFLRSSFILAGIGSIPPAMLTSCFPGREKEKLSTAYIGSREKFEAYSPYFRKLRKNEFIFSSLEGTLSGDSDIVFCDPDSFNKSTYLLLLLEQGKDIFLTYPMGNTLGEYAAVADFMEKYGRVVGMLNPLMFYPSIEMLKNIINRDTMTIEEIRVSCHPSIPGDGFQVSGISGSAQPLERIISYISGSYPLQLRAEEGSRGSMVLNYETFSTYIHLDREQQGWNMKIQWDGFNAQTDHTGLLSVNNEVEPRVSPNPGVMDDSIIRNLEDFMNSVRERSQPRVNSLDGLASIVLNNAVEKSLETGSAIDL